MDIPIPVPHRVGEEEVKPQRAKRRSCQLRKQYIADHFPLHLQYRSWCKHCVAGKAVLDQHVVQLVDRERARVSWSADYAFMPEEAEEGMQPCLICLDGDKNVFWALAVDANSATEETARWMTQTHVSQWLQKRDG